MTAKIEPWMRLAARAGVNVKDPEVLVLIIAAHAPKETGIKPDTAQAARQWPLVEQL